MRVLCQEKNHNAAENSGNEIRSEQSEQSQMRHDIVLGAYKTVDCYVLRAPRIDDY